MKFYVIEIAEGDAKIKGKGIYEYATLNEAVANFHSKLGVAMKSDLYDSDLIMVVNSDGGIHKSEKFVREVATVEEVAEEE